MLLALGVWECLHTVKERGGIRDSVQRVGHTYGLTLYLCGFLLLPRAATGRCCATRMGRCDSTEVEAESLLLQSRGVVGASGVCVSPLMLSMGKSDVCMLKKEQQMVHLGNMEGLDLMVSRHRGTLFPPLTL